MREPVWPRGFCLWLGHCGGAGGPLQVLLDTTCWGRLLVLGCHDLGASHWLRLAHARGGQHAGARGSPQVRGHTWKAPTTLCSQSAGRQAPDLNHIWTAHLPYSAQLPELLSPCCSLRGAGLSVAQEPGTWEPFSGLEGIVGRTQGWARGPGCSRHEKPGPGAGAGEAGCRGLSVPGVTSPQWRSPSSQGQACSGPLPLPGLWDLHRAPWSTWGGAGSSLQNT